MKVEITGSDQEDGVGVEVFDNKGNRHLVALEWDGEVAVHKTDDYPHDVEDRTLDEQKLMTQVAHRAKLAAQREFPDADILDPEWVPEQLERAIEAIRAMPVDRFAAEFGTYYRYVTATYEDTDVPEGSAEGIYQPFLVTADDGIEYVPTPVVQYEDPATGESQMTHRESRFEELVDEPRFTKFTATLPPLEIDDGAYEFPEGFQIFLIEHFGAKIRDVYRHVGEDPPEPYDEADGIGKFLTAADDEYYRDFIEMIE